MIHNPFYIQQAIAQPILGNATLIRLYIIHADGSSSPDPGKALGLMVEKGFANCSNCGKQLKVGKAVAATAIPCWKPAISSLETSSSLKAAFRWHENQSFF